ncbi:MAG: NTP transferase domain-containing protein [Reichenbachiella sp.]
MKPTLLILAAGRGSRFGGAKQVAAMGPSGETIMEYSIYDALKNGFGQIVLVINKDVETDTIELVERMDGAKDKISYVYQDLYTDYISKDIQNNRLKPWGTGHAILAANEKIKGSFAMINADDFYGSEAFKTMADFLTSHTGQNEYSMVGYEMENTLSSNGTVSRGVSVSDEHGHLTSIIERHGIHKDGDQIYYAESDGTKKPIITGLASMNFWGFQNNLFEELKTQFQSFLTTAEDLTKDEFYIPSVIDKMIHDQKINVSVLYSSAKWFGVTYKEDAPVAKASIGQEVAQGKYPNPLWS